MIIETFFNILLKCVCVECEVWESTEPLEGFCRASLLRSFCFKHIDILLIWQQEVKCVRLSTNPIALGRLCHCWRRYGAFLRVYVHSYIATLQHVGIFLMSALPSIVTYVSYMLSSCTVVFGIGGVLKVLSEMNTFLQCMGCTPRMDLFYEKRCIKKLRYLDVSLEGV
jgi:hypothetical protein